MKNKIKYPVILDIDTGIDDAVALVFASCLKNLDLQLVSTVFGNVELRKVIKNTCIILEDINKTEIPIVRGESEPICQTDFSISAHGKNGLGNYTHDTTLQPISKSYLDAYHETISKNELTYIIACGPLTNIAKFIEVHPEDNDKIHLIIVTGLLEIDKKKPYLNFNICKDIEACKQVLEKYKNISIVPSDMGHRAYIPRSEFYKTTKTGRVGKILSNMYPYHLDRTVKDGAAMHDLCGVLYLSNPKIFKIKKCNCNLKTIKQGTYLNFNFNAQKPKHFITTDINIKKFKKIYYKTLKGIK